MAKNKFSPDLVRRLQHDFPAFTFQHADTARWSPADKTVFYTDNVADLFHELGHAVLGHDSFVQDVELISLERDAWEKARDLAQRYDCQITDETVETALDAYRDWLHARALCPRCGQVGVQSRSTLDYRCLNCQTRWHANDARRCELKRRIVHQKTLLK